MVNYVDEYGLEPKNGMTKEEMNIAIDLCIKQRNGKLPEPLMDLSFYDDVVKAVDMIEESGYSCVDSAENFIMNELGRGFESVKINNDFNVGHGHTLSVKIVMPCYCQANCPFCFNKQTSETQVHYFDAFYDNLEKSLGLLFTTIYNRKISLDITGNEPTFNPNEFRKVLGLLRLYKDMYYDCIDKIVLTTNGYRLEECIDSLFGVVDIVNISVHHYDYETRRSKIFRTKYVPSNEDLKLINNRLHKNGIKTTSIAVIYEPIDSYIDYVFYLANFANFSKEAGFDNTRIRLDFTDDTGAMEKIFDYELANEIVQKQSGLFTKIINKDGYEIRIYKGVKDLVDYVIGVEMVIDDDGNLYLDYNKRYPLAEREYWKDFDYFIYPLE